MLSRATRFLSGPNHLNKRLESEKYIQRHKSDRGLMLELAESISQDRGVELTAEDVPQTLASWGQERTIQNRGLYARATVSDCSTGSNVQSAPASLGTYNSYCLRSATRPGLH